MAVVEVVEAKVTADTSQFDRSMNRVGGAFAGLGNAAKKGMQVVGTAMAAGAVAAVGKGVTAFAGFESSMNEVFTLMPGITNDAMAAMGDDVKNFSKEMGVATGEAIPALYQAISAGVPQDNVFDFLETAQMAAVGGVTDLETAVDGISSVVNAYGSDVVSATAASDLMFTAVKLGKTDFEQLSRSIFQVAPIAASMGVEFADVSAALATLTAQGVPTSVAATQMKAAVSELGKEGTKASDAFQQFSGQTFNEFIAGGGDLVGAFTAMKDGADAAGQSVLDSFGSIEAGQAVLALTADGGEAFGAALEEMGASAGATETAFNTMENSLSRDFDKIKANVEVILIEIGEKFAPLVAQALGFIVDNFDTFKEKGQQALEAVAGHLDTAEVAFGHLLDALEPVFELAVDLADKLSKKLSPAIEVVAEFAEDLADAFMQGGLGGAADFLLQKLRPIQEWMERNTPIVAAFATIIASVVVVALYSLATSFIASTSAALAAAASFLAANAALLIIPLALAALVAGVVYAYQNFETFREIVDKVIDAAQAAFRWFMDDGVPALMTFAGVVKDIAIKVGGFFKGLFDFLVPIFVQLGELYVAYWKGVITGATKVYGAVRSIIGFFGDLFSGVAGFVGDVIDSVQSMISFILDLPNKIAGLAESVKDKFVEVGKAILDGIVEGVGAAGSFVADFARSIGNSIIGFINTQIIDRINDGIPDKIDVPFAPDINLPDNPLPRIPKLADGGIVTKPTLAMIGEGGESEAVIPLSKLGNMGGGSTVNVTVNMPPGSDGADVVRALQTYARSHGGRVPILTGQL